MSVGERILKELLFGVLASRVMRDRKTALSDRRIARRKAARKEFLSRLGHKLTKSRRSEQVVDDAFREAIRMERDGDWADAISVYEQLARALDGQPNGEYAKNCAARLRQMQ